MNYESFEDTRESTDERGHADVDLTRIYLRELGSVPLLEREEEAELASRLEQARKDYAGAAVKIPGARDWIPTNGKSRSRKKALWSMSEIEAFHESLGSIVRGNPSLRSNPHYRALADAKNRLDRSRDAMITANLRLVAHVAKKFCNQGMPYMDLLQEGNIGLMKAVEKFEYRRGHKFSTYAFWWIKQAILRAIANKSRTIRIPVHLTGKVRDVQRAALELEKSLGREPEAAEIADHIQVRLSTVLEILGAGSNN